MPWKHKKTSTSLQLACLHLNINIYQRLIAVCFVLIHLHLFSLCFGTGWCQNNVVTIEEWRWGLTLVAQSSFVRWIKLRSCFSLRRVVSSETAARGVHESSLGMLCAGGGRWDVVITPLMCILPHSSWSLQSILGFAVCTPLFPVKEVHEYPSILWLKSLFSGGPLKQPWLWRLWLSSPIPSSFSVFSKSFFQSFLLASSLCTVWLADPKVLCV